jgi:hypothetical protein
MWDGRIKYLDLFTVSTFLALMGLAFGIWRPCLCLVLKPYMFVCFMYIRWCVCVCVSVCSRARARSGVRACARSRVLGNGQNQTVTQTLTHSGTFGTARITPQRAFRCQTKSASGSYVEERVEGATW